MHVILTAQQLYEEEKTAVKPHYFFSTQIIYLANILLLAVIFHLVLPKFSFSIFWKDLISSSKDIYSDTYRYLFI